jgi:hypothetical protein
MPAIVRKTRGRTNMSNEEIARLRKEFEMYKGEVQRIVTTLGQAIDALEQRVARLEQAQPIRG